MHSYSDNILDFIINNKPTFISKGSNFIYELLDKHNGDYEEVFSDIFYNREYSEDELGDDWASVQYRKFIPFKRLSDEQLSEDIAKIWKIWKSIQKNKINAQTIINCEHKMFNNLVNFTEKNKPNNARKDFSFVKPKIINISINADIKLYLK